MKNLTVVRELGAGLLLSCIALVAQADTLSSWRATDTRERIVEFVAEVTDPLSSRYVPPTQRIAVFDNDGTLFSEQPMYVQLRFALDRVRALAPDHPEWREQSPFREALAGDIAALAAGGKRALLQLIMATHAGMSTDEFAATVTDWLASARHPTLNRRYTELVYQPMLELLSHLRANGFKTFIVSAGGIEFMRPWAEAVYGVPPEQVVGSSIRVEYRSDAKRPSLQRLPEINFIDDGVGKPVGINYHIGRRPLIAVGNSDGDFEMLEWTTSGEGPRLGILIHHDDASREVAYDRKSSIGRLDRGLDEADARGWLLVSMQRDWRTVFPTP